MNQSKLNLHLLPGERVVSRPHGMPTLPVKSKKELRELEKYLSNSENITNLVCWFESYLSSYWFIWGDFGVKYWMLIFLVLFVVFPDCSQSISALTSARMKLKSTDLLWVCCPISWTTVWPSLTVSVVEKGRNPSLISMYGLQLKVGIPLYVCQHLRFCSLKY